MKRRWLYMAGCLMVPHIMLFVGILFLSGRDTERAALGMRLCKWSTAVLVTGSFLYYVYFMPGIWAD